MSTFRFNGSVTNKNVLFGDNNTQIFNINKKMEELYNNVESIDIDVTLKKELLKSISEMKNNVGQETNKDKLMDFFNKFSTTCMTTSSIISIIDYLKSCINI